MLGAIFWPVLLLGGMGLLFGLGLGFASTKFETPADPKAARIRETLPGVNCGACGYPGCDAFAEAVLSGAAKAAGCLVGGEKTAANIAGILGIEIGRLERKRAFVRCGGRDGKCERLYDYFGLKDCQAAAQLAGGGCKSCSYGCLGEGSCQAACKFGAISMENHIAVVDPRTCTACGMCVKACPKNLITLIPHAQKISVGCHSKDPGRDVRKKCKAGCIGCKLCEKTCAYDAIHVRNNLAAIDYGQCTQCGACVKKCPVKCVYKALF